MSTEILMFLRNYVDCVAAISHLDKMMTWGKQIRVTLSKHQAVQLPKEGQPDAGLTKDYSNSPLHRFKKPGSKNYQVYTLVNFLDPEKHVHTVIR